MKLLSLKSFLLSLSFLTVPLFGYLFWHASTTPDTLSDLRDFSPTLGTKVIENLSTLPTLPIQEDKDHFKIEDATKDGINIEYANQGENQLQTNIPKQIISFPKDPKQPIEVRLDNERVIPIQDQSQEDYTVDTLIADQNNLEAGLPSQKKWWEKVLGSSASKQEEKRYLRYTSSDGRKTLLYAYEKDQATGEKKLKHWTLYASGTGLEEEKYQLDNVKLKINENGDAEVFYFGEQQIQNEAVKAEVAPSLLERAQKTLEKDLGNDIFNNQTPDFIIPRPYYLDSLGEKRDLDWKWDEEKKTLSVSFSPESYPVALDPTLLFTAPGQSNTGSVITGGATSGFFGNAMTSGDFNSDGKTDLAVGSYGGPNNGRVYIFYNDGSYPIRSTAADVTIDGSGFLEYFGRFLAAGDMNADGRTDLIVGTYQNSGAAGKVYFFYNDGSYPSSGDSADVTITGEAANNYFGSSLIVGDVNADGKVDLIAGASGYSTNTGRTYVFYGDGTNNYGTATCSGTPAACSAANADVIITGESTNHSFGSALTTGDFDFDGDTDFVVGASAYDAGSSDIGRAYLFYNDGSIPTTAATADVVITGEAASNQLGTTLVSGDMNADGKTDLIVGAVGYSSNTGRIYIFYNGSIITESASGADAFILGESATGLSRFLVTGDFNADGRTDLVGGARDYSSITGRVYLFYNDGSLPTTAATADVIITGEVTNGYLNSATSGDFNADGKTDLAVGAFGYASSTGRVYIFYSQNGQVNTNQSITGAGASLDEFGNALAVGDLNADGRPDLAVGAWKYNASDTGQVYIFYGDGQIPTSATSADVTIGSGGGTSDYFGRSLAVGDFNADGKTDLAVGADGYSTNTGRVYIFYNDGSYPGNATTADVTITGESTSNYFGYALSAADLNFDGETDLVASAYGYSTNTGRVYIFHNDGSYTSAAGSADVVITGSASSYLGGSLATGDLNADSRIDLVVTERNTGGGWVYARGFYNDGSIPTSSGSADFTLSQGYTSTGSAIATGDFNADGRTDIAWGVYPSNATYILYNDGSYPSGDVQDGFADVVITGSGSFGGALIAGDFNADGRTDLAIGANTLTTNTGAVYFFYNDGSLPTTSATADVTITGETTSNYFGAALAAEDMNGDGRTDLVVGAYGNTSSTGKVYLYETRENFAWEIQRQPQLTSTSTIRTGTNGTGQELQITGESGASFGITMFADDVNGDGKRDLIIGGTTYNSSTGRVYIFYNDGSYPTGVASADVIITGASTSGAFGRSFGLVDVNSDGKRDLIMGSADGGTSSGRVYIFYNDGSIPVLASNADITIAGEASSLFGGSITTGDFDDSGTIDIVVGAHYYTANYTGRVYIFYNDGSIPTTAASADVIITGDTTNTQFGVALATADLNSDAKTDLVVGADASSGKKVYIFYGGSITTEDATGADVTIVGSGSFGGGLATGDFDADGDMDLAVSDTQSGSTAAGRIRLFYNDGFIPTTEGTADVTITEASSSQRFGSSLAAGDFNGDGRTDLAVGAQTYSTSTGRAFIFYNNGGSYPSAPSSADVILTGGEATNSFFGSAMVAGDFNADGKTDLAVGAYGYSSSKGRVYVYTFGNDPVITGEATSANFGVALIPGDFNSDGKIDLAVGASGYSSSTGRVYLFYSDGSIPTTSATADVTITGETASDSFGRALIAGDFDASGTTDLAVGAPGYSSSTGRVYLFYSDGSIPTTAATADVTITGNAASDNFGFSLASGDLTSTNSYGRDDLVIGAYGYSSQTGRAYIFNNDGSLPTTAATADVTITGAATNNRFGYEIVTGDLNTDGTTDLVVGTESFNGYTDKVYVFNNDGSIPTTAATADTTITGVSQTNFGVSLVTGDFNADGRTDLAVGATYTSSFAGSAYIFYNDGSVPTTAATADVTLTGTATNDYFGINLAAGDFNADGRTDLVVDARGYSSDTGRVYIFYNDGSMSTTAATADMTLTGGTTSNYFGFGLGVGDWNSDSKTDLAVGAYGYSTSTGRVYIFSSEAATADVSTEPARVRGTIKTRGTIKVR